MLGRTGYRVSEIGLGCEGFHEEGGARTRAIIDLAHRSGINYIDLYSPDPAVRSSLGEALRGRREDFFLQAHICTVWKGGQYRCTRNPKEIEESFYDLLARLQTDRIEVGMIHYVDTIEGWEQIERGEVLRLALRWKEEGKIGRIGVSSHNPHAALRAVESGFADVLMFSVNPCYDLQPGGEDCEQLWNAENYRGKLVNMDPDRERLYETCQRLGVGITVMKAFGGGDLLTADSPAKVALTPTHCIAYALDRPAVASVLVGVHSAKELEESLAFEGATAQERDYAAKLATFPRIGWEGHCMYCGHCAPCPRGIDVATVTKFFNLARAQREIPETVREHYGALAKSAGDCVACGACETRCPFGVKIVENMRAAKRLFGK